MKKIQLDKILSVGVSEIDEDHQKLFDIFNLLVHAVGNEDRDEYVLALLDELINCTIWHFSHEERLMLKYKYPALDEHKAEHRSLIASAAELKQVFSQPGSILSETQIEFLERWLTEHILTADSRLGIFLAQAM